jgi:unsaturated chondroitin disaccharide hydrolase
MLMPSIRIFRVALMSCTLMWLMSCEYRLPDQKIISHAETQITMMLEEVEQACQKQADEERVSPRTLDQNGDLVLVRSRDWTSGFFPGILWYLHELTGEEKWGMHARIYTQKIEQEKYNGSTHDMGFKIYCSFGNFYRLTGNPRSLKILVDAAYTLAGRFNPVVGCIRSWDHNQHRWEFPVIIDNMMNLELLFAASRFTGDPSFREIAISHADVTMKNHFREDYGTYHVVDYNPLTGEVANKNTHQGFSDESTWARGQAWALYGYTLCYRETKDQKYLEQAERIASFILNHPRLPDDLVPWWDFDAPGIPDEPRDASAASIIASAFYELSTYSIEGNLYRESADTILKNLTNGYLAKKGDARGFILLHSTGSAPSNHEVDVPLIYSDYYYLEALVRARRLQNGKPVV